MIYILSLIMMVLSLLVSMPIALAIKLEDGAGRSFNARSGGAEPTLNMLQICTNSL